MKSRAAALAGVYRLVAGRWRYDRRRAALTLPHGAVLGIHSGKLDHVPTLEHDRVGIGIVEVVALEIEDAGGLLRGEHVLQRRHLRVQVFLGGAVPRGAMRGHGPGAFVLWHLARLRGAADAFAHVGAAFPLAKILHARLGLGNLLLQLVDALAHMSNVVGELALRAVVSEELDHAVADFGVGAIWASWQTIADHFRLRGEADGDALDTLGVTEVGGEEVEADGEGAFGRLVGRRAPVDAEAVKRRRLDFDPGAAGDVTAADLRGIDEFHRLELATALMRLIGPSAFLP